MQICSTDKCTGCAACTNICPRSCISMRPNIYGETHPVIDDEKCISCKACLKACPNNIIQEFRYPKKCYAAWITDNEKRSTCASGGVGTILSEYVIKERKGVVFGTAYDNNMIPITTYTEELEGLGKFKGSKYVQSIIDNTIFKKMKEFVQSGRFVLYIGTPCQIAAAKTFMHSSPENFVTCDIICHGVSPTTYFEEEISYLTHKHHIKDLVDIRFRGNDFNNTKNTIIDTIKYKGDNNFCLTLWRQKNGKKEICYKKSFLTDYYFYGFLKGITLRENCYSCQYARPERISDLTIGDFLNLGQNRPFKFSANNVSSVTTNTIKGEVIYKDVIENTSDIISIERSYSERLEYKPSLIEPFIRHPQNNKFKSLYPRYGYVKSIRLTIWRTITKNRFEEAYRRLKSAIRILLLKMPVRCLS